MTLFADPITNTTSIGELVININAALGGILGPGLVLTIFVVTFISSIGYGTNKAFLASAFITTILTAPLMIMGIVDQSIMIILILLLGVAYFFAGE